MTRLAASTATALALLGASAPANATSPPSVYGNPQTYQLGSRAAGMGGAYTALACDEAALHYNPAALGCAPTSRVELAANAYMLEHFSAPNALGPGADIGASNYHPLPSIAGFVRLLSKNQDGQGALGFGVTISVPRSIYLAVDPPNPEKKDFYSITVRDDLLAGDLGIGWQATRWLALGASVGGVLRTMQTRSSLLLVRQSSTPCSSGGACYDFVSGNSDTNILSLGARAKLGLRLTPSQDLSLGLTFASPTLDLYGSSELNNSTTLALGSASNGAVYGAVPSRSRGSSDLSLPAKLTLGAALSLPSKILLSIDLSLALPRQVRAAYDLKAIDVEGIVTSPDPIPDLEANLALQPNLNLGVEVPLSDAVVLDFGGFTDLSNTTDADLAADRADRINMFGLTAAIGILGRQARSWFGLSFEVGSGTTRVRSQELSFEQVVAGAADTVESSYTRWNLVGIIGSSYAFVDDAELPPEHR